MTTQYDQDIQLERRYAVYPQCQTGLFPLDEELQLWAGHFTPSLYEGMTRLAIWMPFGRAVKEVGYFLRVTVTEATVRRQTEAARAAYVAVQEQLDFPHAGEHVAQIGPVVFGEGTLATETWLAGQLHQLKHDGPAPVLAEAGRLIEAHPDRAEQSEPLAYLTKREPHMHYPAFQAAGWPIGDGAVESGNKLVVEAHLKAAGCIGRDPMSIRCSPCGTSPATTAGKRPSRPSRARSAVKPHAIAPSVIKYGTPAVKPAAP